MQYQPEFAFILPLEDTEKRSEEPKYVDDTEIPLTGIEIEIPKASKKKQKKQGDEPTETTEVSFRQNFLKLIWYVTRWYILSFLVILGTFYPIFHFVLDEVQKDIILKALAFCDDWKQLIFFFGLYVSFAVKKVSDVSSVRNITSINSFSRNLTLLYNYRIFRQQIKLQIYCRFPLKVM